MQKSSQRLFATYSVAVCFFIGFMLLAGCKPEKQETAGVKVTTAATYGTQNFSLNTVYTDSLGRSIKISRLKFFMSNIKLIKNDNTELPISKVVLIDFENPASLSFTASDIEGDFKGITFGLGLDSALNATDPLSVPNSDPLGSNQNMYWSWLKYIFQSVEGKYDTTTSGTPTFTKAISYHTGGNNLYRTVTLFKSFNVCCKNEQAITLKLDIKKLFYNTTNIDVVTEPVTNTDDFPAVALKMADNFSTAFTIE